MIDKDEAEAFLWFLAAQNLQRHGEHAAAERAREAAWLYQRGTPKLKKLPRWTGSEPQEILRVA